jgi:hypothetical protein
MEKGTVIRARVSNINNPKTKYFVLLAKDKLKVSFATILINSEINIHVLNTPELIALQHPLLKVNNPFLDHDSHVDCSDVLLRNYKDTIDMTTAKPEVIRGILHKDDLKMVLKLVREASTTIPNYLNNFKFT